MLLIIIKHSLVQDLEISASSDAVVREKIASLPPEVSEVNLLTKLEGKIILNDLFSTI